MKTSTIILSALIGSMTFLIVAGALQIRFTGSPEGSESSFETQSIEIPVGRMLIIKDVNVRVISGAKTSMEIAYTAGAKVPQVSVEQMGDTLILGGVNTVSDVNYSLKITLAPDDYDFVEASGGIISLSSIDKEIMTLSLRDSQLNLNTGSESTTINRMNIMGINSRIFINSGDINQVNFELENCGGHINVPLQLISGSVTNDSQVTLRDVREFRISRDQSSSIRHF